MRALLLLLSLAGAQDELRDELIAALPFVVATPKHWRANPDSLERLLIRGEAIDEELAPFIVVERLEGTADAYVEKLTAPKTRTSPPVPVEALKHRLGPAKRFRLGGIEKYPKGAPDARVIPILKEHVALQTPKAAYVLILVSSEADFKRARRDFEKVLDSFRVNDKIIHE